MSPVYYRGTNNPNENQLVKNKALNPSNNCLTDKPEIGVSVVDNDSEDRA